MLFQDPSKQTADAADGFQLGAIYRSIIGSAAKAVHEFVYNPMKFGRRSGGEIVHWQQLLTIYRSKGTFDGVHAPEQTVEIKNKAFVLTVFRCSTVKHTSADQKHISGLGRIVSVIQMQMETAGQDSQDLPFLMPVEGHLVAGMLAIHIVVLNREFQCTVLIFIMKCKRMHTSPRRSNQLI